MLTTPKVAAVHLTTTEGGPEGPDRRRLSAAMQRWPGAVRVWKSAERSAGGQTPERAAGEERRGWDGDRRPRAERSRLFSGLVSILAAAARKRNTERACSTRSERARSMAGGPSRRGRFSGRCEVLEEEEGTRPRGLRVREGSWSRRTDTTLCRRMQRDRATKARRSAFRLGRGSANR